MKKIICLMLAVCMAMSAVTAFAEDGADNASSEQSAIDYTWLDDYSADELRALQQEIQNRLEQMGDEESEDDTASAAENLLGMLFGGGANSAPNVEPIELSVGEKVVTETAEFEVVSLGIPSVQRGSAAGWVTITGPNSKGKFYVDYDCCLMVIVYKVKNISAKSKWYWPSNLLVHVEWDEYEFEKLSATPLGDLQSTQTKEYIAAVEIPNEIAKDGYKDLKIEIGFKESFDNLSDIRYADHRFILPPIKFSFDNDMTEIPVLGSTTVTGGTGSNALTEYKDTATIKAVQQALNNAGYNCGTPDGVAGQKTKAAITSYQTAKGLTVTGTVTYELLKSLGLKD